MVGTFPHFPEALNFITGCDLPPDFGQMITKELNAGIFLKSGIFIRILGYSVTHPYPGTCTFSFLPKMDTTSRMFCYIPFHLEMYHEHFLRPRILQHFHWLSNIHHMIIPWFISPVRFFLVCLFVFYNKIILWWGFWPVRNTYRAFEVSLGKGQSPCVWQEMVYLTFHYMVIELDLYIIFRSSIFLCFIYLSRSEGGLLNSLTTIFLSIPPCIFGSFI